MLDVYGSSCRPRRQGWGRKGWGQQEWTQSGNRRILGRLPSYVSPAFSGTALAALILHLLAELASRLTLSDPAGAVSVLVGMAAVLVILLPFTLLCAKRAHVAWTQDEAGSAAGSAASGEAKPRPRVG